MLNPERLLGQLLVAGLGQSERRFGIGSTASGLGLLGVAAASFEQTKGDSGHASSPPPDRHPGQSERAMLLLQAMIAAGYAIDILDDQGRTRVIGRAEEAGLSSQERTLLEAELVNPVPINELVSAAQHHAIEAQVYAVALMAIEPERETASEFLTNLASMLGLSAGRVEKIARKLENS